MNDIKLIRNKTKLSQSKFAEYFNIPVRTIQKWEINQATPPAYVVEMMKKVLVYEKTIDIRKTKKLPDKFLPLFWDSDINNIDLENNSSLIISRLYTLGGIEGRIWVNMYYSEETIKKAALTRRDFDPIVANYLQKTLNIKKDDMAFYKNINLETHWNKRS